jgi:hypothetical protein
LVTIAERTPNDLACITINSEPTPDLLLFIADKRPEFVTFERQTPFFFALTVTWRGTLSYF